MTGTEATTLAEYFEFLSEDAIRIRGHRIGIEHVLRYYLNGYNPDEIAHEFPGLALEKIYATITYYLANRNKIDAYLAQQRVRDEEAYQRWEENPSPLIERLRTKRGTPLDKS